MSLLDREKEKKKNHNQSIKQTNQKHQPLNEIEQAQKTKPMPSIRVQGYHIPASCVLAVQMFSFPSFLPSTTYEIVWFPTNSINSLLSLRKSSFLLIPRPALSARSPFQQSPSNSTPSLHYSENPFSQTEEPVPLHPAKIPELRVFVPQMQSLVSYIALPNLVCHNNKYSFLVAAIQPHPRRNIDEQFTESISSNKTNILLSVHNWLKKVQKQWFKTAKLFPTTTLWCYVSINQLRYKDQARLINIQFY